MSLTAVLAAATTGVVAGPWIRGLVFAHTIAYGQPPRRNCPACARVAAPVAWRGLLAVAPLRGRCPSCRARIGPPTGATEILAAATLTILALRAPSGWVLAAWAWISLLGIALAAVDVAVHRLPDTLTITAGTGALTLLGIAALTTGDFASLARAVAGGLGLGALYLIPILIPRTGMGRGDGQLAAVIGLCLGWISIETIAIGTAAAVLLAGAAVTVLLAAGRIRATDPVPFGPYLLLGALTALVITA